MQLLGSCCTTLVLSLVLCDNLEEWEGGREGFRGWLKRERIYAYLWLIHAVVRQELAQLCKAIVLQLKKKQQQKLACD